MNPDCEYYCKNTYRYDLCNIVLFEKGKYYRLDSYIQNVERKYEGVVLHCENNPHKPRHGFYFDEYYIKYKLEGYTLDALHDYFYTTKEIRKEKLKCITP